MAPPASSRRSSPPARVLVLGAGTIAELAVVRGVRAAGYEPWVVTWNRDRPAAHTRSAGGIVEVPAPSKEPLELVRRLAVTARRLDAAAVLPGTEAALIVLSQAAGHFDPGVAVGCPSRTSVRRATDKRSVNQAAERASLGVPPTVGAMSDTRFPAVVKPVRSEHVEPDGRLRHLEVRRVSDDIELRAAVASMPGEALVQPYLRAPIRTLNGVAWQGELVACVHQRADRIWRPDCGVLCAAHTVPRDLELERRGARLLADLQWSGMFNMQFLQHDGTPLLIDLNPRPYQSLALAIAAGANLPAIWVDLLLGRAPRLDGYRVGVRWRHLRDDLLAIIAATRSGDRRAVGRDIFPRPGTVPAVFSVRDPVPTLSMVKQDLSRLLRRVTGRSVDEPWGGD
jgi:predicted ATP-grasp superfamily ATP-dependent carboligase